MCVFSIAHFSAKEAGDLSTLFDAGGIIGEAPSFYSAVFPACSYAEVQKKGTAGHDLGSGSREERPPGVFSFLLLRGGVGLRKAVFVLWFPGVMGAGEGCRERWSFLRPGQHVAG